MVREDFLDERAIAHCLGVLRTLARRRGDLAPLLNAYTEVFGLAEALTSRARKARRARPPTARALERDRVLDEGTGLRRGRAGEGGGRGGELSVVRGCYICKGPYTSLHFFYDALCPGCAAFNYKKRLASADLSGRVALVTGARIKIGYQVALKLLRAGAFVIGTTRFPQDAARRFAREPDFGAWAGRLHLYGLDLRHLPGVEAFADHLATSYQRLDILVNNAAQTIRRPTAFYTPLLEGERTLLPEALWPLLGPSLCPGEPSPEPRALAGAVPLSAALSQLSLTADDLGCSPALFPEGSDDGHGQLLDLRDTTSWRLRLADVSLAELAEVFAINAMAPAVLSARLKALMLRGPALDRFIVQVSAVEGQFEQLHKTDRHPHTNMAKAALNMMTRTAAPDYARDRIFMNSVDTGWVTNEQPRPHAAAMEARGFQPPLDEIDGAARVCDPILEGLRSGAPASGLFFKDYRVAPW